MAGSRTVIEVAIWLQRLRKPTRWAHWWSCESCSSPRMPLQSLQTAWKLIRTHQNWIESPAHNLLFTKYWSLPPLDNPRRPTTLQPPAHRRENTMLIWRVRIECVDRPERANQNNEQHSSKRLIERISNSQFRKCFIVESSHLRSAAIGRSLVDYQPIASRLPADHQSITGLRLRQSPDCMQILVTSWSEANCISSKAEPKPLEAPPLTAPVHIICDFIKFYRND